MSLAKSVHSHSIDEDARGRQDRWGTDGGQAGSGGTDGDRRDRWDRQDRPCFRALLLGSRAPLPVALFLGDTAEAPAPGTASGVRSAQLL